jgi:bacterioferritin-associated ferredoxin
MYVCLCKGLTESDVHEAAAGGPADPAALIAILGLEDEDCCGRCLDRVDELATLASPSCAQCPLSAGRLDTQSNLLR